jgi:hypothetical protein
MTQTARIWIIFNSFITSSVARDMACAYNTSSVENKQTPFQFHFHSTPRINVLAENFRPILHAETFKKCRSLLC